MLAEGTVRISGVTLDKFGRRIVADAATQSIANVGNAGEGPCPPLRQRPAPRLVR
jgi:hypothetical protein